MQTPNAPEPPPSRGTPPSCRVPTWKGFVGSSPRSCQMERCCLECYGWEKILQTRLLPAVPEGFRKQKAIPPPVSRGEALMDLRVETPTPPASPLLPIWGFSWISTGCATSKPPTGARTSFPWSCSECRSFSCWCCQQPLSFTHLCRISAQKATGFEP